MIRPVKESDAGQLCAIYNEYVENTTITFEEDPVSTPEMANRIENITSNYPWLVHVVNDKVTGYTYASRWKERSAYRHAVETGIYLDLTSVGQGIGTQLKKALLEQLREKSIHTVISGIALPNAASIALFEKLGFEKVAHFKEVGYKLGQWVDVGYWQLLL